MYDFPIKRYEVNLSYFAIFWIIHKYFQLNFMHYMK